jgi:hypothetical protein
MITTIAYRFFSWAVLLSIALVGSCHGYQLQNHPPRAAFFGSGQRKGGAANSNSCTRLFVGADFDSDFEAALGGQAPLSEYERDAEFYRKRNEAYYDSLSKADNEEVVATEFTISDATSAHANAHAHVVSPDMDVLTDSINTSIKASQSSFKYVEKTTFSLLGKPLVALSLFAVAGILVAYLSGFFFLEGYIENWNPVENDAIPYWNDAEIHTIERALPPN